MGAPYPSDDPTAWNRCELANLVLPGIAKVKVGIEEEIEVKKAKGSAGATVTHHGDGPANVVITLSMTEPEQWAAWQEVVPLLRPRIASGKKREPVGIIHPKTTAYKIKGVHIQKIDDDADGDSSEPYVVTITCIEHFKSTAGASSTSKKLREFDNNLRPQGGDSVGPVQEFVSVNGLAGPENFVVAPPSATGNKP
jgi:hypothetical protein